MLRLLKDLVEIESVNDPEQGKRPTADGAHFIRDQLREGGIESQIAETNGFFAVRGTLGKRKPRILLLGHWDVVPAGAVSRWKYPPFRLTVMEDRAYGRGSVDDKGNVAAMLTAMPDILERGGEEVAFAFTGDEEVGGRNGAGVVAREIQPEVVVNGDGLGLEIINRRRNIFRAELSAPSVLRRTRGDVEVVKFATETKGRETRHSAYFVPGVDSHALLAASEYALRENLAVVSLRGGFVKDNVIPDEIEVEFVRESRMGRNVVVDDSLSGLLRVLMPLSRITFPTGPSVYGINVLPNLYWGDGEHHMKVDIRAMTHDAAAIEEAAKEVLDEFVPEASMKVLAGEGCLITKENCALVKLAKEVAMTLGIPPRVVERQGASDSRYFSPKGIDCIDFGPLGGNIHGPNEYVIVSSLDRTAKFYTELVARFLGLD